MTPDDYVHAYCCGSVRAMCGYYGPDEPPNADHLPRCPECLALDDQPCGSPACPEGKEQSE